jgi:Leucine-rich repeat (LRR) protein
MKTFNIETYLNSLPEDILEIYISYKNITYIPESIIRFHNLQILYCDNNQLTCLPVLPESLKTLYCYSNNLTCLSVLPKSLQNLHCNNNQLTSLPVLPESLQILSCGYNQLTYLPVLPESLQRLYCEFNSIYDILNTNNITSIKYKINVLNKFRYLYYCLRLKKKFIRYYLWSKRKNYLMLKEGSHIVNDTEYTHNYILNEYVGRDIMSYM